jgi:hypothetical protein
MFTNGYALPCIVESVTDNVAVVIDYWGRRRTVNTNYMRAKGTKPRPQESWYIERMFGEWYFTALVNPRPPTVTIDCQGHAGLLATLNLLEELGLIVNESTLGTHP